jgi:hypothetical protein
MTKQGGFPIIRRRGSDKVKPSMACVLHWSGGKVETLENFYSSIQVCLLSYVGLAGGYCTESIVQFCLEMC